MFLFDYRYVFVLRLVGNMFSGFREVVKNVFKKIIRMDL